MQSPLNFPWQPYRSRCASRCCGTISRAFSAARPPSLPCPPAMPFVPPHTKPYCVFPPPGATPAAMSKRSQQIDAFFRQGQHLHMTGRLAEAEQIYRQVIAAAPRHADALHALGALALQAGRPAVADTLLNQAIGLKPAADYHLTRANVLLALSRPLEAVETVRLVLRARPHSAEAHQVLGHALSDGGQPEEASTPTGPRCASSRGCRTSATTSAWRCGRPTGWRRRNRNCARRRRSRNRWSTCPACRRNEAPSPMPRQPCVRRCSIAPDSPVLRYNWSLLMLLLGRTPEAWDGWEQRFRAGAIPPRPFTQPQWSGDRSVSAACWSTPNRGSGMSSSSRATSRRRSRARWPRSRRRRA